MADDTPSDVPPNFIILDFADGEYEFRLPIGQIGELQTKAGAGIGAIYSRLMAGRYKNPATGEIVLNPVDALFKIEDIRETIRLGLIGGGRAIIDGQEVEVSPMKALNLIRDYVDSRPLMESWRIAAAILSAFIMGYDDKSAAQKKSRSTTKAKPSAKATST